MLLPLLTLAFQLQVVTPGDDDPGVAERAHSLQGAFERARRARLPWTLGGGGRCDVRVGRFCWWYEDNQAPSLAEPEEVSRSRRRLLADLDSLGRAAPSDAWIAGLRVHYRVDARLYDAADSVARQCVAVAWWCGALRGYAALASDRVAAADSAFTAALRAMPDSTRCAWQDIAPLLPAALRGEYERQSCAEREHTERRYWLLATPRLGAVANEWHLDFIARRVVATLLATAVTPHRLSWGPDTEELLLRYGWPVSWSRTMPASVAVSEPDILGHDPAPSFHYGARAELLRDSAASGSDGWDLGDVRGESRYAHPRIRRLASLSAQLARFRRGDSTLLVGAWTSDDDALTAPVAVLGAARADGSLVSAVVSGARTGTGQLRVAGRVAMEGVELTDSVTGTFARSRRLLLPGGLADARAISDILLFSPGDSEPAGLDDALARALPGDAVDRSRPLGLYWEAYGEPGGEGARETTVRVERFDHGVVASLRQRFGLADPDSPLQVRWTEPAPASPGVAARALTLDLARLPAGRYRIGVALADGPREPLASAREIVLSDP